MVALPPTGRHAARIGRSQHRVVRRRPARPRRHRSAATVLGLTGGLSLIASAVLLLHDRGDIAMGQVPISTASVPASPAGATLGKASVVPASPRVRPTAVFVPSRLAIPRLGVDAAVLPVSVGTDRSLGVPDDPAVLGWWRQGAHPGQPAGSVVIDGHVDTARTGPGALFRLRSLVPGDIVVVSGQGRAQRYVVAARRQYPKAALPAAVFDQRVSGRLVLVTCGGRFDSRTRHYADNVVVFARPA